MFYSNSVKYDASCVLRRYFSSKIPGGPYLILSCKHSCDECPNTNILKTNTYPVHTYIMEQHVTISR